MDRYFDGLSKEPIDTTNDDQIDTGSFSLDTAYDEYVNRDKTAKTVLVQRDERYFWEIIFKQNFNLTCHEINVRFAGEAGSDDGGPLREFLTLSMRRMASSGLFFGGKNSLGLTNNPEAILDNRFHKIGQLTALSILLNGRGPETIHPAVVRTLFEQDQPKEIEPVEDAIMQHDLNNIRSGNYDVLYDMNIVPNGKSESELIRLYMIVSLIHSKCSGIEQFREGVKSVSISILHRQNYMTLRKCFQYVKVEYTFDDIIPLISYPQLKTCVQGSNEEGSLRKFISDFELFLLDVGQGKIQVEDGISLEFTDILFFTTGTDRIPPYGFGKKIEVMYDEVSMVKVSTCGLILRFPKNDEVAAAMVKGIKFGSGFGVV